MVARFPNMIAIMYNSIKTGNTICEVPVNKLCIQTLRLLREQNLIFGFQFISKGEKTKRLFPRVRISLKYSDVNGPCITHLKSIKNKFSNFKNVSLKLKNQQNSHKKIMLTTAKGLDLVSINEINLKKKHKKGKILLEISF